MVHLAVYIAFFAVLAAIWLIKPRWTYLSAIPLAILAGVLAARIPFRNVIEGSFGFVTEMVTVAVGAMFVAVLKETGALAALMVGWSRICKKSPFLQILGIMAIGLVPGMYSGSALLSFAVLSSVMFPILREMGIASVKARAITLVTAVLGMMAPPVSVPMMILNGSNWGSVLGVGPYQWLIVIPCLLFMALFFSALSHKDFAKTESSDLRKVVRAGDVLGIGAVLTLSVLRTLFPTSELGSLGTAFIIAVGIPIAWFAGKEKACGFFAVTSEGVLDASQVLLLFVTCSLIMQVSQYTGLNNAIGGLGGLATKIPAALSIGIVVVAGILLGSMWEGLGAFVVVPVYMVNTLMAYYSAVVAASAIFTAVASSIVCLGILLPLGWKRSVMETGPFEKGMAKFTMVPALILFAWIMIVYLTVGPVLSTAGKIADATGGILAAAGGMPC